MLQLPEDLCKVLLLDASFQTEKPNLTCMSYGRMLDHRKNGRTYLSTQHNIYSSKQKTKCPVLVGRPHSGQYRTVDHSCKIAVDTTRTSKDVWPQREVHSDLYRTNDRGQYVHNALPAECMHRLVESLNLNRTAQPELSTKPGARQWNVNVLWLVPSYGFTCVNERMLSTVSAIFAGSAPGKSVVNKL